MKEDTSNPTHSPSVEDQINSFVSGDTEPQDIEFSKTSDLIDSVYSQI